MTREEAILYAEKRLDSADYRLEMGYMNDGLRQIASNEFEFFRRALNDLRAQQAAEKNEPLTLDELREMDGGAGVD